MSDSGVAQAVEHLPEEEGAAGSTPAAGTGSRALRTQHTNSLIRFSTRFLIWRSRFIAGVSVAAATRAGAFRVHDVAVACYLAGVDVWVRLPLDALTQDVGKPGNPPAWGAGERRFKSGHPDCRTGWSPTRRAGHGPLGKACVGVAQ